MPGYKGYRGFPSRKAYEEHYSDPKNYADEIPAMEQYTREAEAAMPAIPDPEGTLDRLSQWAHEVPLNTPEGQRRMEILFQAAVKEGAKHGIRPMTGAQLFGLEPSYDE